MDETAGRFRAASQAIQDLQAGVAQEISQKVNNINTLARNIADVNQEIARAQGKGTAA